MSKINYLLNKEDILTASKNRVVNIFVMKHLHRKEPYIDVPHVKSPSDVRCIMCFQHYLANKFVMKVSWLKLLLYLICF